jgi:5'-3' exonuclease
LESSSRQAATNLISYTPTAQHRLKKAGISQSVLSKLLSGREIALQSKQLATIITDVPIKLDLDACKVSGYDKDEVIKLFDELGFKSLVRKLPADEFELSVQDSLF